MYNIASFSYADVEKFQELQVFNKLVILFSHLVVWNSRWWVSNVGGVPEFLNCLLHLHFSVVGLTLGTSQEGFILLGVVSDTVFSVQYRLSQFSALCHDCVFSCSLKVPSPPFPVHLARYTPIYIFVTKTSSMCHALSLYHYCCAHIRQYR